MKPGAGKLRVSLVYPVDCSIYDRELDRVDGSSASHALNHV
jgi:hypothetical protein